MRKQHSRNLTGMETADLPPTNFDYRRRGALVRRTGPQFQRDDRCLDSTRPVLNGAILGTKHPRSSDTSVFVRRIRIGA